MTRAGEKDVDYGVGRALRLTGPGKGLWCKMFDGDRLEECIPLSQIADRSEVQDVGDMGMIVVTQWWAEQPKVLIHSRADGPLVLLDDQSHAKAAISLKLALPRNCHCTKVECAICVAWWDERNRQRSRKWQCRRCGLTQPWFHAGSNFSYCVPCQALVNQPEIEARLALARQDAEKHQAERNAEYAERREEELHHWLEEHDYRIDAD